MPYRFSLPRHGWQLVLTALAVFTVVALGTLMLTDYRPLLGRGSPAASGDAEPAGHDHDAHAGDHDGHEHDEHDGHEHDHATAGGGRGAPDHPHTASESIEISDQARGNLRLTTETVTRQPFVKRIDVPAVVTAWPGRTHLVITSPLTGVINSINVARGERVVSGDKLFSLRLTHQDLVETQEEFLTALGQLDVEKREIERLTSIASEGVIAGKKKLAREYERDKLLASLRGAKQSMLLHGLTEPQIERIEKTRGLIREVTITVPQIHADGSLHHDALHESTAADQSVPRGGDTAARAFQASPDASARLASMQAPPSEDHVDAEFLVSSLSVQLGQSVQAGAQLAQLSDYRRLLIEGFAYQRDAPLLRQVARQGRGIQAVFESGEGTETIEELPIVYIDNEVDTESRSLSFFVSLPNEIERSEAVTARRFVSWRFKPGQRLELRVPVKSLERTLVVPREAVVEAGPERFVFVENGEHFDRVPVTVEASDAVNAAIKDDGQLRPGQRIAVRGAHQLQMALKNRGGGAIDPHAGHNH